MSSRPSSSREKLSTSNDYLQVPSLHRSVSCSSLAKSFSASEFVYSFIYFSLSHAIIPRFAALKPVNGLAAMEPGTDTWLWERNTFRLFRLKLPDIKSDFSKQFNQMIDLYDRLTEFRWPKEWAGDVSSFKVFYRNSLLITR